MTQYALVSQVPLIRPNNLVRTLAIPEWTTPFEKKALICDHTEQRQQYNEFCNVGAALRNHLLTSFEDTYISPLKNAFAGYSRATTLTLLIHLYGNYARILTTHLAENDKNLMETYNTDKPLESLYMILNEYLD